MNEQHTIDGERTYRVYRVSARWQQRVETSADPENVPAPWREGCEEGRFWNSTSRDFMLRDYEKIENIAREYEAGVRSRADCHVDADAQVEVETTLLHYETWCLTWFGHFTFYDGRSDEEFVESFERFVRRMERKNATESTRSPSGYVTPAYPLMGAEDRWRWHGVAGDGEDRNRRTTPPCRCEKCKGSGKIHIFH